MATPTYVGAVDQLKWSAEYTEEQGDDGTMTGRAQATCKWSLRAMLQPAKGSKPGPPGNEYSQYMWLTRLTAQRTPAGLCKFQLYYQGVSPSGNLPESYGEFLAGQSESPIQTHPDFKTFAGTPTAKVNNSIWNPDDGTFIKFAEYLADGSTLNTNWAGVQSYSSTNVTWRWHTFSANGDYALTTLDKTYTTPTGFTGSVTSPRNWLHVDHSCVQQGYIFHITDSFLLSGRNGWNSSLYAAH